MTSTKHLFIDDLSANKTNRRRNILLASSALAVMAVTSVPTIAVAQDEETDEIVVEGIRSSLANALNQKREAANLTEVIVAEDIGKLPDQNLAEVLENITGIQITRTAGVGTDVQIRGTDANRTEINGVSTVGDGSGRGGISFEDLPASLIASVEVTKVPEASTIEGSVGGTINLRTIRPLDLSERLIAVRAQGEYSNNADTVTPRFSGTIGDNWTSGIGDFGAVFSGSYARTNVASFRPRVDRDAIVTPDTGAADGSGPTPSAEAFPFLRSQFFVQEQDAFKFETLNLNLGLDWQPTDNLRFYADGIYNDQEQAQEGYRLQFSGVSASAVVDNTNNTSFETVDFGTIENFGGDVDVNGVQAVATGVLLPGDQPGNGSNQLNPNLRSSTDTGSRLTESAVFRVGGDWESNRLKVSGEFAHSLSDTDSPNFSTTLDFINPNAAQPAVGVSLDNGIPVEFDLTDGLTFGIAQGFASTPTTAQLLDPSNYQLRQVQQGADRQENRETAFRFDLGYDVTDIVPVFTSVSAGYRYSDNSSLNDDASQNFNFTNDGALDEFGNITSTGAFARPGGELFAEILVAGPDNFDSADGRDLFVQDFLQIDPSISFDDPNAVRDILNAAITASNAANAGIFDPISLITVPTSDTSAFFDIEETTHAAYFQANFDTDNLGVPVRGNLGVRYVDTSIDSTGNTIVNDTANLVVTESSYNFWLPRFNIVAEPREDVLLRLGVSRDIRRPNFDNLSTSVEFNTGPNDGVEIGNPGLLPESVWSFDVSAEYYFAPSSILSVGFFHKIREDVFTQSIDPASRLLDGSGQTIADVTGPVCEDGGVFNPIADPTGLNLANPTSGDGVCVDADTVLNGEGVTTQTGVETAFQYNLSAFEDRLGWASGFGFIGNYTYQRQGGSATEFESNFATLNGPRGVFSALGFDINQRIELPNLSNHSFNTTLFYEKYGLSARARYTWRSSHVSLDDDFFGVQIINGSRGQLNANINYALTDNLTIFAEGINLTQSNQEQFCVANNALLCFEGLTDRRLTGGISLRF